jgi:drug/metabolite transporter (DMT)-like permease
MSDLRRSFIFAGLAVFFWSTIATAFKLALNELSPGQLLFIAAISSLIVLGIIIIQQGTVREVFSSSGKEIAGSAILGLLNPFLYYLILLKAYTLLPAQVAQPLNMIWPIVLVFLSVPLLRQKIPGRSILALFISFAGIYLISSQGKPFAPGESDPVGVVLAAGSSILWALYFILNVRDKRKSEVKLFINFFFATVYILVYLLLRGDLSGFTLKGISLGIYIGIFEMGLTFFLWLRALSLAESSDRISNLVFFAPLLSLLFISIILGEKIHYTTLVGLIILIFSLLYQNTGKR